ncbi:MAG: FeoA family protein [Gemmataceae bacterium]
MHLDLLPLELLRPGQRGEVCDIAGDPSWIARLAELGIRIGCRLRLVQCGSTCMFQCEGGTRLSLRGDENFQILVRPLP